MPKAKNKKDSFIDKKSSVSFHLVHRSQQVSSLQSIRSHNLAPRTLSPQMTRRRRWFSRRS